MSMMKRILILTAFCILAYGQSKAQVQPLVDITDREYEAMLQGMADKVLYKFDNMPGVRFVIKEDPRFYKDGKLHALAFYTRDDYGKPIIYVNPNYHKESKTLSLADTVFHELTHAWVDWKKMSSNVGGGHNEAFLKKAIELNLDLSGTLATFAEAREIYDRLIKNRTGGNGLGGGGGNGTGNGGGIRSCEPMKTAGCFGANVYQYQFFEIKTDGEYTFKESRLFLVGELPKIGSVFSWSELFPGKTWRVHSISGSVIQILEHTYKNTCDPSRNAGCYGANIYNYQFISNAGEPKKIKFVGSAYFGEGFPAPKVGSKFYWKEQTWRCYAITGSIAWFTEADKNEEITPAAQLPTIGKDNGKYYVLLPPDFNWYQIVLPSFYRNSRSIRFRNKDDNSFELNVNGRKFALTDESSFTLSEDYSQPVYIRATKYSSGKSSRIWIEF